MVQRVLSDLLEKCFVSIVGGGLQRFSAYKLVQSVRSVLVGYMANVHGLFLE